MNSNQPLALNSYKVSGLVFYRICAYVGSQPLRKVFALRSGMWAIQKDQQCTDANALPSQVEISKENISVLVEYLMNCPCDEVIALYQEFEQELINYTTAMQEAAIQAANAVVESTQTNVVSINRDAPLSVEMIEPEMADQLEP